MVVCNHTEFTESGRCINYAAAVKMLEQLIEGPEYPIQRAKRVLLELQMCLAHSIFGGVTSG
jgi:hypothetical protein